MRQFDTAELWGYKAYKGIMLNKQSVRQEAREEAMPRRNDTPVKDLGLLALRLITGGLLAGHGAQKLFGLFGGFGLEGTAGWIESLGLKPAKTWALLAGGAEFGSGLLTAVGLFYPLGPLGVFGPMLMAWATVHAGKPIWAASGGAELPLINMTSATALALLGPGRYSLDEALGIEVPAPLAALAAVGIVGGVAAGVLTRSAPPPAQEQEAGGRLQAEEAADESSTDTALAP